MTTGKLLLPALADGQVWRRRDGTETVIRASGGGLFRCDRGQFFDQDDADPSADGYRFLYAGASEYDLVALVSEAKSPDSGLPAQAANTGYVTKDSGVREEMATGSVRDSREGKGRFELVSPFALARLAGVYERGAAKYDSRNWEKGQPYSRFLDSAMRHLNRFAMGWRDEDHLAQAAWNIFAIMHFQELGRTELDDMPHYQDGPKEG